MKHTFLRKYLLLFPVCLTLLLCACTGTGEAAPDFPFSDADWDSTKEDIFALEGTDYTTYDSVYGGICYTYPKTYENYEGTIKYMLDSEDKLMCVAWTCSSESDEELASLFDQIKQSVQEKYGEDSSTADNPTNYGAVWHREEGNIVLSTMITSDLKALQYAYLNPAVSTAQKE